MKPDQEVYPILRWWIGILLAATSGLLIVFSVPPWNIFFLAWICLIPLITIIYSSGCGILESFIYGWITGIVAHGAGFYWLTGTLVRFGNISMTLSICIFIIFIVASGTSYSFLAVIFKLLIRRNIPVSIALLLSIVVVEGFFPHLFPWYIAMSHWEIPLAIQTAEIWGIAGISAILAFYSGVIFEYACCIMGWMNESGIIRQMRKSALVVPGFIILYGAVRMELIDRNYASSPGITVGVVQPNISIKMKRDPSYQMRTLLTLQSISANLEERGAKLIIWPETAYPFPIQRGRNVDFKGARRILNYLHVPVLTGAISYADGKLFNSAYIATPEGKLIGPSDKNNLVLFGEYNPFARIVPESLKLKYPYIFKPGLSRGNYPVVLEYGNFKAGVLNCFEDTLPDYTAEVVRTGAEFLANLTNDAWFGDTAEPWQHLALSVFRSVENRRYLVRSVNTGVSAVVNLVGKTIYMSQTFKQDFFIADIKISRIKTPFQYTGDWLKWFCASIILTIFIRGFIKSRRKNDENR